MLFRKNINIDQIHDWDIKNKHKKLVDCLRFDEKEFYKLAYELLDKKKALILPVLVKSVQNRNENIRQRSLKLIISLQSPEVENHLIKFINDKDSFIRAMSINALGNIHSDKAVTALIKKLDDEEDGQFAARALGKIKSPISIHPLSQKLKSGMVNAAWALGEIDAKEAEDDLKAAMFSKDVRLNIVAAEALRKIGWLPQKCMDAARYYLITKNFESFTNCGIESTEVIGEYSMHPDPEIRKGVAKYLGLIAQTKQSSELLISMIKRKELPAVQAEIVNSLGIIRMEEALEYITEIVKNTTHKDLQYAALTALGNIGSENSIGVIARFLELDILTDIDKAIKALVIIGGEKAIRALVSELDSENPLKLDLLVEALQKLNWVPTNDSAGATYYIFTKQYQKCVELENLAVTPLHNALNSTHQNQVIWALGEIGTGSAVRVLMNFYEEESKHNAILKKKVLNSLSQTTKSLALKIYETTILEPSLREITINGLIKIAEPAIPLLVQCLISGYGKDKIVPALNCMRQDALLHLNQLAKEEDDASVINSIIKLIESKES